MSQSIGMVSLGCAKNQVDAEQMLFLLQQAGYNILPEPAGADVVIVNTCGFIESAKTEAIDNILRHGTAQGGGKRRKDSCDRLPRAAVSGGDPQGAAGGGRRARHWLVL